MLQEAKRAIEGVRDFYRLDQSKWQEQIKQVDSDALLKEINRYGRLARIEETGGYNGFVVEILGGFASALLGNIDLGRGLLISAIPFGFLHLTTKASIGNRMEFLNSEVSNRREQAVFYQDVPTLAALEVQPS